MTVCEGEFWQWVRIMQNHPGLKKNKSNNTLILHYLKSNEFQSALGNPEMCRGFYTTVKTAH